MTDVAARPEGRRRAEGGPATIWRSFGAAVAVGLFVQVPSIPVVYKYVHHRPALVSVALVVVTVLGLWLVIEALGRSPRLRALAGSWWLTGLLLVAIALISVIGYPHEHLRQVGGSGSTSDLAMQRTWTAFVHGRLMYAPALPRSAPISPGPLWVILNGPFTQLGIYSLMAPVWFAGTAVALRLWYRRGAAVNIALLVLLISPVFARLLTEGHDIPEVSCAALLLLALADRLTRGVDRPGPARAVPPAVIFGLGLAAATVATSRVIYIFVPVLLAVMVWRRDRRAAVAIGLIGVVVAGGAQLVAAVGVHGYGPTHLFDRAGNRQPVAILVAGVAITAIVGVATLLRTGVGSRSWLWWYGLCWAVPLLFIGFGELSSLHGDYVAWEGANYVFAGSVPLMAGLFAYVIASVESVPARR